MGSTCNHVAAGLFRMEAATRVGLSNPACTSKANDWLPNRKEVDPCKVKDMKLNRDDFSKRHSPSKRMNNTPKKQYNPLQSCSLKKLSFHDIVDALGDDLIYNTTLSTAIPQPKIDFVREVLTEKSVFDDMISVDDIILMSCDEESFFKNLEGIKKDIIRIEEATRGQSSNPSWFDFRKGVITASKVHEVKTKMNKVLLKKGSDKSIWNLIQKVSGLTFVPPSLPALKYGRETEKTAAEKLVRLYKKEHKKVKFHDCGLFLNKEYPFIGASPDGLLECSCHPDKVCVEIKCPFSISYLSPADEKAELNYLDEGRLKWTHQYYSQCQLQMGITGTKQCIFFVYTAHGFVKDVIDFDKRYYDKLVQFSCMFYRKYYLKSVFK